MPVVDIRYATQPDAASERALIADVTDAVVRHLGAPEAAVAVILTPVPSSRWGVAGTPLSDRGI